MIKAAALAQKPQTFMRTTVGINYITFTLILEQIEAYVSSYKQQHRLVSQAVSLAIA